MGPSEQPYIPDQYINRPSHGSDHGMIYCTKAISGTVLLALSGQNIATLLSPRRSNSVPLWLKFGEESSVRVLQVAWAADV